MLKPAPTPPDQQAVDLIARLIQAVEHSYAGRQRTLAWLHSTDQLLRDARAFLRRANEEKS